MSLPIVLNKTRLIGLLPRDGYATAERPGYPSQEWAEDFERRYIRPWGRYTGTGAAALGEWFQIPDGRYARVTLKNDGATP